MDIPWPTVPSFQTRVIYLWICVFTQHHDSTPQVILHLVYFFYPLTLWVVILVAIIRCRDWNTKRISNTIFKVTVHVWQSWALNPGILAARSTSFLPAPEILNKWSLSQQICITWEPVRNANYWALPKTDGIRNLCFTQPCSWFCCRLECCSLHHDCAAGCLEPEEGAPRQTFSPRQNWRMGRGSRQGRREGHAWTGR